MTRPHGPRTRFLARPFWRDYVLAYVLIGIGLILINVGVPISGFTFFSLGFVVFFCAVGWSIRSTWFGQAQQPSLLQYWSWQRRIDRMKRCLTGDELIRRCGEPAHRVDAAETSIWHYPLRVIGGTLYAIHVAVVDGRPTQVYLAMEPTA